VIHRILVYGFLPGSTEKLLKQILKFDIIFLKPDHFEKIYNGFVFFILNSFLLSKKGGKQS